MKMSNWKKMLDGDTSVLNKEVKEVTVTDDAIYRVQWRNGQRTNLVDHAGAIRIVNESMNRLGWDWIRVTNAETKKQQIVYEPTSQSGRGFLHLKKLSTEMLKNEK